MTKVDNGGSSRLEIERAGQLEAFPNPKMHKAFPPSEVLIDERESLIFLSFNLAIYQTCRYSLRDIARS